MAPGMREMVVLVILVVLVVERMDAAGIDVSATSVEFPTPIWKSGRRGSHEDSVDEFLDEPTRRILATTNSYVSYGALNGNRSPCPSAGRSYYNNCKNTGPVQPYRRGCVQITRCARG